MPIPPFDHAGVLPPYLGDAIAPGQRSPYAATMEDVVGRFATSHERREILRGLLDYRGALRAQLGIADGIQWLDGSFVEDVERVEARPPGDVDVLTIARFPPLSGLSVTQRELLASDRTKSRFRCDAYPLDLERVASVPQLLAHVTYWFGLFSHRRDGCWKGLLAVAIDPADDARARLRLDALP
jgi:hypothetical protein